MLIGEIVAGFKVISPIAAGGMGRVYLAQEKTNGRRVAIKVLPDHFLDDRKRSQYLEREVRIAKSLRHANVIHIYGLHVQKEIGYLLMEYMDGGNLRPYIQTRALSLHDIINLILQICAGLHYIHNHKLEDGRFHSIIHRDVKPENILMSSKGQLKVADFGLSIPESFWGLRASKRRAGTPLYMSPEQIRGKIIDIRTDIYSLGLVIYELLTSQLPYKVHDKELYMKTAASKKIKPAPPSYINRHIPRRLDEITLRALEKEPDDRYQTVAEMMLDFQRLSPGLKQPYDPALAVSASDLVVPDAGKNAVRENDEREGSGESRPAPARDEVQVGALAPKTVCGDSTGDGFPIVQEHIQEIVGPELTEGKSAKPTSENVKSSNGQSIFSPALEAELPLGNRGMPNDNDMPQTAIADAKPEQPAPIEESAISELEDLIFIRRKKG